MYSLYSLGWGVDADERGSGVACFRSLLSSWLVVVLTLMVARFGLLNEIVLCFLNEFMLRDVMMDSSRIGGEGVALVLLVPLVFCGLDV